MTRLGKEGTMRALIIFGLSLLLSGCTTLERQESIRRESLEQVVVALPIGMTVDSISKVVQERGWKVLSDQATKDWPFPGTNRAVDRVFTILLPKHAGMPFSISVFGYAGAKDGRVVLHHVAVEANAL